MYSLSKHYLEISERLCCLVKSTASLFRQRAGISFFRLSVFQPVKKVVWKRLPGVPFRTIHSLSKGILEVNFF